VTQSRLGRGLPPYLRTKWHLDPSSHLATIDMGQKLGAVPPFFGEYLSNTESSAPRLTSVPSGILIHTAVWPQRTWAKSWGLCASLLGGGVGYPSKTLWPGLRPTCVPSFVLIRPTVWPQCTNVTDRQTGQRTDSIGRTVLQINSPPPKKSQTL